MQQCYLEIQFVLELLWQNEYMNMLFYYKISIQSIFLMQLQDLSNHSNLSAQPSTEQPQGSSEQGTQPTHIPQGQLNCMHYVI